MRPLFAFVWLLLALAPAHADLIAQARIQAAERYRYAQAQGAQIHPTPDGRAFYVLWLPPGAKRGETRFIVTLHGHASWALDEFALWHKAAAQHGMGILALQWWFGGGESARDYYAPLEMYPQLDRILRAEGVNPGAVLLHGFSRGSANSYALAAIDHTVGGHFFGMVVSNAGGAMADFPPNRDIAAGRFGARPFDGLRWVMFCGGRDENPQRDGCGGMQHAREWVENLGAKVDPFIEDSHAGHGGFHRNPRHIETALEAFERLRAPAAR